MTDTSDITLRILEKIQDDLVSLRDRLEAFEGRMERRWEANDARWEANDARWEANDARWEANDARWRGAEAQWREIADEQRSWRKRLSQEQKVRERNARKTLELFDVLIRRVEALDGRVGRLESGTP